MSRAIPMAACIALLRAFDKDNPTPQQAIATAAAAVEAAIGDDAMADVNDGQFAALIDLAIWKGVESAEVAALVGWVKAGNFAKPVAALASYGPRGKAERAVWNVGNSG